MKTVKVEVEVDELVYDFYQRMGRQAGLPVERVMYDALFRLAADLSVESGKNKGNERETP